MGAFDELKNKAERLIGGNKNKTRGGVEKGADMVDKKTGGKYNDKVDTGEKKANETIDKMPGKKN